MPQTSWSSVCCFDLSTNFFFPVDKVRFSALLPPTCKKNKQTNKNEKQLIWSLQVEKMTMVFGVTPNHKWSDKMYINARWEHTSLERSTCDLITLDRF